MERAGMDKKSPTPRQRGGRFQRLPDEPDSFTEWWEGGAHRRSRGARREALAAWEAAAAAERERCAKLCEAVAEEDRDGHHDSMTAQELAHRIRRA